MGELPALRFRIGKLEDYKFEDCLSLRSRIRRLTFASLRYLKIDLRFATVFENSMIDLRCASVFEN